jgi:hypothetical protein
MSPLISVIASAMMKIDIRTKLTFETYENINNSILLTIKAVLML